MKRHLGILALILVTIISGINNPLIRYALHTMPVFLFGFLRVGIALLIIGPIALIERNKRPARKRKIKRNDLILTIIGSMLILCVANLAFYIGIKQSTTINSSIIELLHPVLFFMISIEVLKEKFNRKVFGGILLAFIGAAIVVLGPMLGIATATTSPIGNLILFGAVAADVVAMAILKKVLKRVHVLDVLVIGLLASTIFYAVLALPQMSQLTLLTRMDLLLPVLYGSIMMGCIGYGLNYFGLAATKGSDYSIIGYLTPVVATTVAIAFFHESFTPSLMVGGSVVFIGLYLVEARNLGLPHIHGVKR